MPLPRRSVLSALAAGSFASGLPSAFAAAPHGGLPNILWLVSEDNNPFIGAYGDKIAHTPNIDALASRGVLFRNVYSPAPVCAPTRFGILTGAFAETCSPAQHMRANARLPRELRTYPEYMRNAGYYCTNNDKTDYNCDVEPDRIWDASDKGAHWKNRPDGKPFLSVFNFMTTHEYRLFLPEKGGERFAGKIRIPAYLPKTPEIEADYAKYYALMSDMDGQVGEKIAEVEAAGLANDTIIFYYSDNGGVLPRSKRYCYDEGLRVALVVYVPPKWRHLLPVAPGTQVDEVVNLIDLPPTLLSIAGIAKPKQMQGRALFGAHAQPAPQYTFGMRNRMDERYDFVRTVTDGRWRYIRNYMPHRIWGMRGDFEWAAKGYQSWEEAHIAGTLTSVQNRFFETKPFEELYDVQSDPDQIQNLIGERAQSSRVAAMRKALDRHMLAIRDNGFIPEGSDAEGYAASRDERIYPIGEVMALAQAAARRDPRKLDLFRAKLASPNGVVRYWAATGLLILGDGAMALRSEIADVAANDPWPSVRVVAGEALCHVASGELGVRVLGEILSSASPFPPRLMAINSLSVIGKTAEQVLPALQQAATDSNEYIVRAARPLVAQLEGSYNPRTTYGRGTTAN